MNERHFTVDLRKLRLAVGAQVFIAKTFHDLEILVEASHHQDLFESLRRLRQGIELPFVHTAGHHEVAGAFRRGFDQIGRFHFHESLTGQILAGFDSEVGAEQQVALHGVAAQVEVAIFHTQVVAAVGIILNGKRWCFGCIQHLEARYANFYVAGFTIRVFAGPFAHGTAGLNDEFAAEFACAFAQFGIVVHIEHQLGNAVAVAQVDEGKAAQVAADGYPAGQGHFFIDIRKA